MRVDRRVSVLPFQCVVVSTASTPRLSLWTSSKPLRTAFCSNLMPCAFQALATQAV